MRAALDGRYIQDHFPGIGRYAYALAGALARTRPPGAHLTVPFDAKSRNTRHDLRALARTGARLRPVPVRAMSPAEQAAMPVLARRWRLGVLHVPHCVRPLWLPCAAVVNVHDLTPWRFPEDVPSRRAALIWELSVRWSVRTAGRIITLSEAARRDLIDLYGACPERVVAIPAAADERFTPASAAEIEAVRARFDLPERFILYVGINKPHKNLARLIEAFAGLERAEGIPLVLAGRRDPRFDAEDALIERLGLGTRVCRLGEVPEADLPALYSAATVFAFPSLWEGFGLPAIEAMRCGAPAAISNSSALGEIATSPEGGLPAALTFDPTDVGAIRAALQRLLDDEAFRAGLARRGLAHARSFTWEAAARRTWQVYAEAVAD